MEHGSVDGTGCPALLCLGQNGFELKDCFRAVFFRTPPSLETDRLRLRPLRADDFDIDAAFYASERSRFVGGPLTRERAWLSFSSYAGHWSLRGFGQFAIEEKSTGLYCGRVGPYFPEGWPEPEIAWTMSNPEAEGRGLAFEAAKGALDFVYGALGWKTVISLIAPANTRSISLAERLRARPDGWFTHERYGALQVFRHAGPGDAARTPDR